MLPEFFTDESPIVLQSKVKQGKQTHSNPEDYQNTANHENTANWFSVSSSGLQHVWPTPVSTQNSDFSELIQPHNTTLFCFCCALDQFHFNILSSVLHFEYNI